MQDGVGDESTCTSYFKVCCVLKYLEVYCWRVLPMSRLTFIKLSGNFWLHLTGFFSCGTSSLLRGVYPSYGTSWTRHHHVLLPLWTVATQDSPNLRVCRSCVAFHCDQHQPPTRVTLITTMGNQYQNCCPVVKLIGKYKRWNSKYWNVICAELKSWWDVVFI